MIADIVVVVDTQVAHGVRTRHHQLAIVVIVQSHRQVENQVAYAHAHDTCRNLMMGVGSAQVLASLLVDIHVVVFKRIAYHRLGDAPHGPRAE